MKNYFKLWMAPFAMSLALTACNNNPKEDENNIPMNNPFFSEFNTPFGVPDFDAIQLEHYMPAFEEGMKQQMQEVQDLIQNPEEPTFENTIEALEFSGSLLNTVSSVFYNLNSANTNKDMQEIASILAPKMSEHSDNIYLNPDLFKRVKQVWEQRENLSLSREQERLLEQTYKGFVRGGANLSDTDKETLRNLNKELSSLSVQFGQNMLEETNGFELVIENEEELAGLPQELIGAAKDEATERDMPNAWVFTLQNPSIMPFLQFAQNRDLRYQIWNAYQLRGNQGNEQDNTQILVSMANLRNQKARLLGYQSHSHFVLEESMAGTPDKVMEFLNQLWKPAIKRAQQERDALQTMLAADIPGAQLEPWDWRYYEEKRRTQLFDFDANELKPYFELNSVKKGIFYTLERLYDMTFEPIKDIPVYHKDVTAYEVKKSGKHLGVLYMDFHPRASKRGGAWMTSYRKQSHVQGNFVHPVISIVCNFSKPVGNDPALLTFDEVTTFFHEFGHAIHGLLSNVTYRSLSGTSVPRDFVELPSQILECWAAEPEVLQVYAKHFKTQEVIPEELINKMNQSEHYGQGFATVEYLAASFLDMAYHTQTSEVSNANEFEKMSMNNLGLIQEIIPRYRSTYFAHIFAGGYSSGYYSYIWSALLDADAFAYFKQEGIFNPEIAQSFYTHVLSTGGTEDPAELYRRFRGADPDVTPLLQRRGLIE